MKSTKADDKRTTMDIALQNRYEKSINRHPSMSHIHALNPAYLVGLMKHGGSWYWSSWQIYKWLHWAWCRVACDHRDECKEWKSWKRKGLMIVKVGERRDQDHTR